MECIGKLINLILGKDLNSVNHENRWLVLISSQPWPWRSKYGWTMTGGFPRFIHCNNSSGVYILYAQLMWCQRWCGFSLYVIARYQPNVIDRQTISGGPVVEEEISWGYAETEELGEAVRREETCGMEALISICRCPISSLHDVTARYVPVGWMVCQHTNVNAIYYGLMVDPSWRIERLWFYWRGVRRASAILKKSGDFW